MYAQKEARDSMALEKNKLNPFKTLAIKITGKYLTSFES